MAEKNQTNNKAGIGIGLAAAAVVAAAGAYYLYGKQGAQHRRKVKGWMLKARGEVLDALEGLTEVTQDSYNKIVDRVTANYQGLQNVDKAELVALAMDLKKHWNNISREVKAGSKTTHRTSRPASRKAPAKKKTVARA